MKKGEVGVRMQKTIWKRFGGWIKGNRYGGVGNDVNNLDAEGLLVDLNLSDDQIVLKNRKMKPIAAIEEGFSKLTEVIREMNDNVSQHREQAADLNRKVTMLVDLLPDGLRKQNQNFGELTEQIKIQTLRHEQVAEMLKLLPDQTRKQLDQLDRLSSAMETSVKNQSLQSEAFSQFNTNVKNVSDHSKAQAASLANIGRMMEENERHLQNMIDIQNKRFSKLFIATIALAVTAVVAVCAVIWLAFHLQQSS